MHGENGAGRVTSPPGADLMPVVPPVRWRRALLRIAVSAALLVALFMVLPLDELWSAVRRISVPLWIVAVGLYMALHLIGVAKWRLLVNAAGAGLAALHAVRCYYVGLFSNTFLPSVVGGDVVRAAVAMRQVRSKEALVLGSMVDRIQDVLGLAAVAMIGALLLQTSLDDRSRGVFWVLGGVCAAGVVSVALLAWLLPARRFPYRMRRRLVRIRVAFRTLANRPRAMAGAFLLGMLLQTLQVVLNAWLGGLIGLDVPLPVWLFVWPLAKIAATLPVTQGGIGVREAALAALFAPFGVPPVQAVAVSLIFQVVIISGGLLGGVLSLLIARIGHEAPLLPRSIDGARTMVPPHSRVQL